MVPYMPAPDIAGNSLGQQSDGMDPLCLAEIPSGSCLSPEAGGAVGAPSMYLKNSYVDQQIAVEGIWYNTRALMPLK